MKATYRIPTTQYGFLEIEEEFGAGNTPQDFYERNLEFVQAFQPRIGLKSELFNKWLDGYLSGKAGSIEEWAQMSEVQNIIINEIKKSHNRNK